MSTTLVWTHSLSLDVVCEDCTKVMTPYGLRLTWELPSVIQGKLGMILTLHLKDSLKVSFKVIANIASEISSF